MPVVTLAELVVDQAIGIAIGVAAIVAAPKAGPKLASLSEDLADTVKAAALPAAQAIVAKTAGGLRWYGQQWAGLLDETTAQPAAARTRQGESTLPCSFNFKMPDDPAAILDMVRPMIEKAGGSVVGEKADVSFSVPTVAGRFDGACTLVEPMVINIAVTDKPDIVSCKMVRDQLTKYITQAVVMYREQSNSARRPK